MRNVASEVCSLYKKSANCKREKQQQPNNHDVIHFIHNFYFNAPRRKIEEREKKEVQQITFATMVERK